MPIIGSGVDPTRFNRGLALPYELRNVDFHLAMQDAYDFFFDVNSALSSRGLGRFDDMMRPAAMSGILSDMLIASLAKHARALTENQHFNGHPDLIVAGKYPNDSAQAGQHGIEIKTTRKPGGAVDTHGPREQWMCVFVDRVDDETQPVAGRAPMKFTEIYLAHVTIEDCRGILGASSGPVPPPCTEMAFASFAKVGCTASRTGPVQPQERRARRASGSRIAPA